MKNVRLLEQMIRINEPPLSKYDDLVHNITFARTELGITDQWIPFSIEEAQQLYDELLVQLNPPTQDQLDQIAELEIELGATLETEELGSEGQAHAIIHYLKEYRRNARKVYVPESESGQLKGIENLYVALSLLTPGFIGFLLGLFPTIASLVVVLGLFSLFTGIYLSLLKTASDTLLYFLFAGALMAAGAFIGLSTFS